MKITRKGAEFCERFREEAEDAAYIIGREFRDLTGLAGEIRLNDSLSSVDIIRPACGRGCCPEEWNGGIDISIEDLMYPSLKINKMRTEVKEGRKISNSSIGFYRNSDNAKGIYKEEYI